MPIIFLKTQNSFEKNNITRDNNLRTLLLAFIAIFFVAAIIIPTPSMAVHKGAGDLVCGQCHTMHSSQGGTNSPAMGGNTGSFLLLRGSQSSRADIHKLCLQCHSQYGSQSNIDFAPHGKQAPKVHGSGWNETMPFGQVGAGGDFSGELQNNFDLTADGLINALGRGHSVGLANASPPGNSYYNTTAVFTLTCTACHDPHGVRQSYWDSAVNYGVNLYRNLIIMRGDLPCQTCHIGPFDITPNAPGELHQMKSWIGGITGVDGVGNYTPYPNTNSVSIWPVYNPNSSSQQNVYDGISDISNDLNGAWGDGGVGEWCARCHPKMHEGTTVGCGNQAGIDSSNCTGTPGQDWMRHPANYEIDQTDKSGSDVPTIAWAHYQDIVSTSFGEQVPAANTNTDLTNETYYANAEKSTSPTGKGDKVFCLTCHFAHGGPYYDALRWDYTSAVSAGSQRGNEIPSDKGCQQCHNR